MNKIYFAILQAKGNCFIFELVACRPAVQNTQPGFFFGGVNSAKNKNKNKTKTKTWYLSFLI